MRPWNQPTTFCSSIAAAVATAISEIANMAVFASVFGGNSDDDGPNPAVAMLLAILAPMAAGLMQMALSRSREFEADRIGAEWGYDEINLNVGCPSDRVQRGSFGACLMARPQSVADAVAAMRAANGLPVSTPRSAPSTNCML